MNEMTKEHLCDTKFTFTDLSDAWQKAEVWDEGSPENAESFFQRDIRIQKRKSVLSNFAFRPIFVIIV